MTTFYQNYVALCAKCGKSLSAAAEELGLSRTSPNGWKKGKMPSAVNQHRLAEYFGVTVAQLMGEEEQKETPAANNGGEGLRVSTDYDKLNDVNKAIIDDLIAKLVKAQSEE